MASSDEPSETALGWPLQAVRLLLGIGGGLLVLSSLQPWAVGTNAAGEAVTFRPTEGLGEGVYMLVGGILVVALALYRGFFEATNRMVQLLPLAVGLAIGLISLNAARYVADNLRQWASAGWEGQQTLGPLMATAGVVTVIAASLALELVRPAGVRRQTRPLVAEIGLSRGAVQSTILGFVLGLAGAVLPISLMLAAFGWRAMLPGLMVGIIGFLVGIGLSGVVARRFGWRD